MYVWPHSFSWNVRFARCAHPYFLFRVLVRHWAQMFEHCPTAFPIRTTLQVLRRVVQIRHSVLQHHCNRFMSVLMRGGKEWRDQGCRWGAECKRPRPPPLSSPQRPPATRRSRPPSDPHSASPPSGIRTAAGPLRDSQRSGTRRPPALSGSRTSAGVPSSSVPVGAVSAA